MHYSKTTFPKLICVVILFVMFVTPMEGRTDSPSMMNILNILFPSGKDLLKHKFQKMPVDVSVEKAGSNVKFTIPIPHRDWYRVNKDPGLKGAAWLATFISPKGKSSGLIEVFHHQLDLEVDSQDWLKHLLLRNKVKIMAAREENALMGQLSEVIGVAELPKDSKDDPTVFRVAAYRSGQSLIIIRCSAAVTSFLDLSYQFTAVTHMFQLNNPQPEALVGKWSEYCLNGGICYKGPGQGLINIKKTDRPEEQAFEIKINAKPAGRLNIKAILPPGHAKTSALKRIDILLGSMANDKFGFTWDGKTIKSKIAGMPGDAYYIRAKDNVKKMDLFVMSLESPDMAVLVWSMTPDSETNPEGWMHNKRVFEIACNGLKINK